MNRKAKPRTRQKTYQLQVVVEVDEDGKYVAWCPALQACYTQGDTFEEVMANIRDVIAMCLEELQEQDQDGFHFAQATIKAKDWRRLTAFLMRRLDYNGMAV